MLGACAPGASPGEPAPRADELVVPMARAAQIVNYQFAPTSPHSFTVNATLPEVSSERVADQGIKDTSATIKVSIDYVADFERHGYYGLLVLARPYYNGEPASLGSYDLPSLTTQTSSIVQRQISLDVAMPMGTFPASGRIESHNRINQIRLTIMGLRQLDSAPAGQAPPQVWQLFDNPLDTWVDVDVLDDRLVEVDYSLRTIFERDK